MGWDSGSASFIGDDVHGIYVCEVGGQWILSFFLSFSLVVDAATM